MRGGRWFFCVDITIWGSGAGHVRGRDSPNQRKVYLNKFSKPPQGFHRTRAIFPEHTFKMNLLSSLVFCLPLFKALINICF